MHLEEVNLGEYQIYLCHDYVKDIDFSIKEEIADYAKLLVLKLKKNYGVLLLGYYQMTIYVNDKVGMFVELKKLDDLDFDLITIDLKVIILLHQPFYLKTNQFEVVSSCRPLYYSKGFYYVDFDSIEDYLPYLEFGTILYGEKLEKELHSALCLQK